MPERELRVVGVGRVGGGVLAHRSGRVALGGELVSNVGARVSAPEPEQAAQLPERVGVVVDAQVDELLLAGPSAAATGHHQQRRGLAAAQVAALALSCVERSEQALGELAAGGLVAAHHGGRHGVAR